ncbi:hypothetical protein BAUCODRAFT_38393 [Baudoinia panamericana UAMH 10762]|uniref:DNA/RNA-binding domain-containing protein n=1 Tax=Baudoinia panamericana (strain UAMH 10762) TaxID=717646 RepID=M2N127_BAUPA|nr:uncharacterized protein BAUCODRAFT_38393 [Baudoinia panamericana UAMH 10762]EMC92340.1 hypothetical protein BAUCODRAFT_38393 [Baudoinia panamericana UAMH 10762]
MEDSLARERTAEQRVQELLNDKSRPIGDLLQAYNDYRQICLVNTFADFAIAEKRHARLWQAHVQGKSYFSSALRDLRKVESGHAVETRKLEKLFKDWLKDCTRFYRTYIHQLNSTFGGIPELEAVAHALKQEGEGESSSSPSALELRPKALASCHQTLIYLGDLSRYRATENLDKVQDFGPAIGYYGLASTLRPDSGLGHHQQAVVALEQRNHLRAIYHLYRAIVVDDPHPAAAKNLKLEFGKINVAWDKQELIPKGLPNDPEMKKHILTGWFVRLHSMCSKGEPFSSHYELEREVLGQLDGVTRYSATAFDSTLVRMAMVNLSAQYFAGVLFQERQAVEDQLAFFYLFRLNIKWYTVLLHAFYDDLCNAARKTTDDDNLASNLTVTSRLLLPALRLYSSWLTSNIALLAGLAEDDFLKDAIVDLWAAYAHATDILADDQLFGVWALDEYEVDYMLEEDADTVGFHPLHQPPQLLWKNWRAADGTLKPRFSDANVVRFPPDKEMLARVKGLLDDGSYLAHEEKAAPIGIVGGRIYYGTGLTDALAAEEEARKNPPKTSRPVKATPKPLSYAAAAANGSTPTRARNGVPKSGHISNGSQSRSAQLKHMIECLVDDREHDSPTTPPQQHTQRPAAVTHGRPNSIGTHDNHNDFSANVTSYQLKQQTPVQPHPVRAATRPTPPALRTPRNAPSARSSECLQSVSDVWNDTAMSTSPHFPVGLPTGTLGSPAQVTRQAHSRVNSANSIRSGSSQHLPTAGDSWSSLESAPAVQYAAGPNVGAIHAYSNFTSSDLARPMLFGAGGGIWSPGTNDRRRPAYSPNG